MSADLTVKDVATRLATSPSTIRKMCASGELSGAYRLRASAKNQSPWRIPPEAIEEHKRRKVGTHVPRSQAWREAALDAA